VSVVTFAMIGRQTRHLRYFGLALTCWKVLNSSGSQILIRLVRAATSRNSCRIYCASLNFL
jgi:hypothetical protein